MNFMLGYITLAINVIQQGYIDGQEECEEEKNTDHRIFLVVALQHY